VFPRNAGVMLTTVYLDMNLQRAFTEADGERALVEHFESQKCDGGVLGAPLLGVAYAADNGPARRSGAAI
jgi:hypothetical protein